MTEHELTESQLVGSRIRDARINRRMSQADLAAKANISLPHVSNIEKGKTSMKLETFIRIIEALQVSADSLLRPDVPEVRSLYQSEFDELLADCSPKELDSILKIVRELKSTMARRAKELKKQGKRLTTFSFSHLSTRSQGVDFWSILLLVCRLYNGLEEK